MKKTAASLPAVGAGSLLAAFAVLCLTVFALLSLSTVQSENRLAQASLQAVADYYAADMQAEEIFARLRSGENPDQVIRENGVYRYSCEISSHQQLQVALEKTENGWRILCWQAVSCEPEAGAETLPVWHGETD